ncbi:hypothetical protein [Streptomyces sp. NPDC002156]
MTTSAYDDVVLLHAGRILPDGTPTNPIAETSAQSTDLEGLVREVGVLWQRLDAAATKNL